MEPELILGAIILVAGFVIPAVIVIAPITILERRWSKIKLGPYILMAIISHTLGFLGAKSGLFSAR